MPKVIKVRIVDGKGKGISGVPIQEGDREPVYTDKNGDAVLKILSVVNTTIRVNGFIAYDGAVDRIRSALTLTRTGGHPK